MTKDEEIEWLRELLREARSEIEKLEEVLKTSGLINGIVSKVISANEYSDNGESMCERISNAPTGNTTCKINPKK